MAEDRTDTALLVIDMQKGYLYEHSVFFIDGAPATVPLCAEVIRCCRTRQIPVFFVTRCYAPDGSNVERGRLDVWQRGGKPVSTGCAPELSADLPEAFDAAPGDRYLVKPRFSAFFATDLDLTLRRLGIRRLVLIGTTTPNCIRTTCYDAIALDYDVTILSDCTSSKTEAIQQANLLDMANIGAQILRTEEWMAAQECRTQ